MATGFGVVVVDGCVVVLEISFIIAAAGVVRLLSCPLFANKLFPLLYVSNLIRVEV